MLCTLGRHRFHAAPIEYHETCNMIWYITQYHTSHHWCMSWYDRSDHICVSRWVTWTDLGHSSCQGAHHHQVPTIACQLNQSCGNIVHSVAVVTKVFYSSKSSNYSFLGRLAVIKELWVSPQWKLDRREKGKVGERGSTWTGTRSRSWKQGNGEELYHKSSVKEGFSIISVAQRHGWIVAFSQFFSSPKSVIGVCLLPRARIQWLDSCCWLGIH